MRSADARNARLEEAVRATLAELLLYQVKDPRLDGVVVSSVRLSRDRSLARVYFSLVGDDERERQAADGFAAAKPFLRRELAARMRLRSVPELLFERDTSFAYGDHMERVFERLRAEGELPPEPEAPAEPTPDEEGS